MELRKKYGITLLAIQRGDEIISNPDGNFIINGQDILLILGDAEKIKKSEMQDET